MARTPRAYVSQQTTMSCCRCTAAFGVPVVPEVYSQNATSSLVVAAGARSAHSPAEALDGEAFRGRGVPPIDPGAVHDRDRGTRVVQHVLDLGRACQRIQGNADPADLDRTPKGVHELRSVGEEQGHAIFHAHAEPPQG